MVVLVAPKSPRACVRAKSIGHNGRVTEATAAGSGPARDHPPHRTRRTWRAAWSSASERRSLAVSLLVLQLILLAAVVVPSWTLAVHAAQASARSDAIARARATVLTLALDPQVLAAVTGPDPAGVLRASVERVRAANEIGFLVVMSPTGVRFTHPSADQVGLLFQGNIAGAQRGETTVEDYTGTLGRSVRVVTPVLDDGGRVVALVSAGVPLTSIVDRVRASALRIGTLTAGAVLLGLVGTSLAARRLHRLTYGLGPAGLARLHSYHDALLHSVRAGLVLVGNDRTVVLWNDDARRLLDTPDVRAGDAVSSLGLDTALGELMSSGRSCDGEVYVTAQRTLVVTQVPAVTDGTVLGWVTTLLDRTDLIQLAGELDSLRGFADSLRARAHEADNRLHTVVALIELGEPEQAVAFATATLTQTQQLVDDVTTAISEPPLAALLLGKAAQADERGVHLELTSGTSVPATGLPAGDLVVIVGNIVDNAIDAASDAPAPRWVQVSGRREAGEIVLAVTDSGAGLSPKAAQLAFTRGWSTKPDPDPRDRPQGRGLGLALAEGAVRRLGGVIEIRHDPHTQFIVRLPLPLPLAAAAAPQPPGPSAHHPARRTRPRVPGPRDAT